ncbi:MAG TPA: SMP-30/gluconolactonase/LRE family protein [Acidobacteriaceae bacterium]|jgi:D-xylonolactonase|nr:SMP-30/gluconolactonase/LRE family protein [Acidobacteriaceae bacterium]
MTADPATPVETLANDGNLCGEGPHWDEREQTLWWTDIDGKKFYRWAWRDGRREIVDQGFTVNGFTLQEHGGLLVTNSEGAWLWHPGEKPFLLAREAGGQKCRLNDCLADPEGRVFSGSFHLNPDGTSPPSYLFRIDTDGSVHIADEGISFSNGLAFSPDCSTLYFTDMVARCVYAYDWRRRDGALSNRRVFVRIDRAEGMPDGLTVDAEGYLWIAHWFGGCVTRYDPGGKRERKIQFPAAQISSLAFGGPHLDEIYVTSAALSNCLMLAPEGYDPNRVFVGGPLYRMRLGIQGKLKFRSRVRVSGTQRAVNPSRSAGPRAES